MLFRSVVVPNPSFTGIDNVFMFTAAAVSPGVSTAELLFSVTAFTLVYLALLVVEVRLLFKYVRGGVPSAMPELLPKDDSGEGPDDSGTPGEPGGRKSDDVLDFAY